MLQPLDVLIAEDSLLDAELLVRELTRAGFEARTRRVDTEEDFLRELQIGADVILSDFDMPQFNGLRALELLQESGLDLPFILISGTIGEDLAVTAMQRGVSDYLMKDRLGRLGPAITRAIERKRLEREGRRAGRELRENAAFVNDVLNSLTAAVVVLDDTGGVKATNEAWRLLVREFGRSEAVHGNLLLADFPGPGAMSAAHAEAAREGISSVLRRERTQFAMEYACPAPAEARWYLMRVSTLSGTDRGVVVAHENITNLKLAELTLRESEERFRRLIENASDVIVVIDSAGVIEFISPSAKRALDFSPAEMVGHRVLEFIHEEDQQAAAEAIERLRAEPENPRSAEYRVRHRDGSWRIFQSVGKTMRGERGGPLVVINSRDVTETHRLEEQFLRAQRLEAIGTLSSGIAHDLNNILAPMLMVAPLLRDKLTDPQDGELLTLIEHAAQRGANIIRQLLTFSRGVDGKRLPVQARYLVKEMMTIMRETFPREISMVEKVPPDLWPVIADATQIHQVLLNLCVNARDAMRSGGTLTVSAKNLTLTEADAATLAPLKPGLYACLTVADTGEGISRENLNRIFEPFFTTKEIGKGTGLGLSTVLGIVKSHGGLITVQSEVGRGTAFNVFLPAMEGVQAAPDQGLPARILGAREMILVVDDEAAIRRALRLTLEEKNYRVIEAADGREALALFLENRESVRLLLTDVMMPGMSGVALVRAIRTVAPKLPVIAASGLHDENRTQELASLGVTNMIAKPCGAQEILEAVQAELAQKE